MLQSLWIAPLLILTAQEAPKEEPRATRPTLASFVELQERLGDPTLRLLDARPRADYDKGHIPGAVWVDAKAVEAMAARPGALADRAAWEAWIKPLGIGPESNVLVYDASRQLEAARIWWLLSYLGVEDVGLIDGGFPLWSKGGRPVTAVVAKPEPREFSVHFRTERHAPRSAVLEALKTNGARIVDARTEGEYAGTDRRSKRGGHIPAACHLEWNRLVDEDGRFLDESALREKLDNLGVKPGEPVITHCQGGGRASVNAFVLERLGFPTRNYYESWSDWGNAQETPIESGSEARPGK